MGRRQIDVTAHSTADPAAVFALLADGSSWPRWSPIDSFELERQGDPPPEGVGAIRVFRRGRTTGRDEIVEVLRDRRLCYISLSGLPVREYRAHVDLDATAGGTDIRWARVVPPESARHRVVAGARSPPLPRSVRRRSRCARRLARLTVVHSVRQYFTHG